MKPSKTLFVINFDTHHTRTRDLERHFEPYGKIVSVRIRRNFAFVQYESQDDATKALDATNMRYNILFKTFFFFCALKLKYLIFKESHLHPPPIFSFSIGNIQNSLQWKPYAAVRY